MSLQYYAFSSAYKGMHCQHKNDKSGSVKVSYDVENIICERNTIPKEN